MSATEHFLIVTLQKAAGTYDIACSALPWNPSLSLATKFW